jgi:hypothetical protein
MSQRSLLHRLQRPLRRCRPPPLRPSTRSAFVCVVVLWVAKRCVAVCWLHVRDRALSALDSVVEHGGADVGLSYDLVFLGKYRDLCVLRRELDEMEAVRRQTVTLKAASLVPPTITSASPAFGAASAQPKPARSRLNAMDTTTTTSAGGSGVSQAQPRYEPSVSSALSGGSVVSSSLALAAGADLNAYEARVRAIARGCLEIVVRVIAFKVAPKKYWLSILNEALPLLERPPQPQLFPSPAAAAAAAPPGAELTAPLLSVADTHTLMAALQEVMQSHRRTHWMKLNHCSEGQVQRLRLTLLRTLSKAIQQREESAETEAASRLKIGAAAPTATSNIPSGLTHNALASGFTTPQKRPFS